MSNQRQQRSPLTLRRWCLETLCKKMRGKNYECDKAAQCDPRLISCGEGNIYQQYKRCFPLGSKSGNIMAEAIKKDIGKLFAEGTEIDEAVRNAVKEAARKHRQAGEV